MSTKETNWLIVFEKVSASKLSCIECKPLLFADVNWQVRLHVSHGKLKKFRWSLRQQNFVKCKVVLWYEMQPVFRGNCPGEFTFCSPNSEWFSDEYDDVLYTNGTISIQVWISSSSSDLACAVVDCSEIGECIPLLIGVGATIKENLTQFGEMASFCDVHIIASGGTSIPAHKTFLMMRSEVFRTMFSSSMLEASNNTLTIDDVEPEAVQAFVRFTYTDTIGPNCALGLTCQLYTMAHKYLMSGLQAQCVRRLQELLDGSNAIDILSLGDSIGGADIQFIVLTYITKNAAELSSQTVFAGKVGDYMTSLRRNNHCHSSDQSTEAVAQTTVQTTETSMKEVVDKDSGVEGANSIRALLSALAGVYPILK